MNIKTITLTEEMIGKRIAVGRDRGEEVAETLNLKELENEYDGIVFKRGPNLVAATTSFMIGLLTEASKRLDENSFERIYVTPPQSDPMIGDTIFYLYTWRDLHKPRYTPSHSAENTSYPLANFIVGIILGFSLAAMSYSILL